MCSSQDPGLALPSQFYLNPVWSHRKQQLAAIEYKSKVIAQYFVKFADYFCGGTLDE